MRTDGGHINDLFCGVKNLFNWLGVNHIGVFHLKIEE